MVKRLIYDADLVSVLSDDGVFNVETKTFENLTIQNVSDVKEKMGTPPWGARVVYNELFGCVLICQNPGEGNRLHYHEDADECWFIVEGEWEWFIEGFGKKKGRAGDMIVVQKGIKHQITCVGVSPGIRLAITKPDVNHIYINDTREKAHKGTRFSD